MEEKIRAIFDSTIKVMVPFVLLFLAWTSFQIVETDRTQERVLQRLSDIEAKLLAMDGKVDDRWHGKDQKQLDKTTDARFDAVNNRLQRLEAYQPPYGRGNR